MITATVTVDLSFEESGDYDHRDRVALRHLEALPNGARLVVKVGRRAETIANTAQELGCDRIVLGDAGEGGNAWFGSIAQQVRHLLQMRNARLVTVI